MKVISMHTLRLAALACTALMLAACSSPSVRQSVERPGSAAAKPAPAPAPSGPVVRPLSGVGVKETPISVKPLAPATPLPPSPAPAAPLAPSIERAPVAELPAAPSAPETPAMVPPMSMGSAPVAAAPAAAPVQLAMAAPAPSGGPATVALARKADEQVRASDLMGAAATLERALRIEPNNAGLWSRLAEVRLRQGDKAQAEQLALKSNGLAGADATLRARNDQIIAQARGR